MDLLWISVVRICFMLLLFLLVSWTFTSHINFAHPFEQHAFAYLDVTSMPFLKHNNCACFTTIASKLPWLEGFTNTRLSGWKLKGVNLQFSIPPGTVIPANWSLFIVSNVQAFCSTYSVRCALCLHANANPEMIVHSFRPCPIVCMQHAHRTDACGEPYCL